MVVYQYVYRCDCRYVGRTSQRLQDRIKEHVPRAIRNRTQPDHDLFQFNPTSISAIGQHLLNNEKYVSYYGDKQFSILAKGRTLSCINLGSNFNQFALTSALSPERIRLHTKITSLIWTRRNVWLSTNQNVPIFSPTSIAINTSPSTPGFILAITPEES